MTRLPRGASLLIALAASLSLCLAASPAAQADVPAPQDQVGVASITAGVNPSQKVVYALYFTLYQNGGNPAPGTQVHISTFSCGRFLQENTVFADGSTIYNGNTAAVQLNPNTKDIDLGENSVNRWVSKSIQYQIDVVQPGYDAYHLTGSITDYGTVDGKPVSASRPSCEELAGGGGGGTQCVVKAKAKKVGQARVGRTVKVGKPKTNGQCGRTSYTWKVAGKTVKKGKTLHIGKAYKGKSVTVKVTLSKGPDKVLKFGRVR